MKGHANGPEGTIVCALTTDTGPQYKVAYFSPTEPHEELITNWLKQDRLIKVGS